MARGFGSVVVLAVAGATLLVGAVGCTPGSRTDDAPSMSATPTGAASTPTDAAPATRAAPTTSTPTLRPHLAASENLGYFDAVNLAVIDANESAGGRDFIDALVSAGFDRSQMEVTADRTTVDLRADSVQFAVLFQGRCLIGQYGPASGGYHSAVRPALGTGGCLVGQTRPIDW